MKYTLINIDLKFKASMLFKITVQVIIMFGVDGSLFDKNILNFAKLILKFLTLFYLLDNKNNLHI